MLCNNYIIITSLLHKYYIIITLPSCSRNNCGGILEISIVKWDIQLLSEQKWSRVLRSCNCFNNRHSSYGHIEQINGSTDDSNGCMDGQTIGSKWTHRKVNGLISKG